MSTTIEPKCYFKEPNNFSYQWEFSSFNADDDNNKTLYCQERMFRHWTAKDNICVFTLTMTTLEPTIFIEELAHLDLPKLNLHNS